MNLEAQLIEFIQQFLKVQSEVVISHLEKLLRREGNIFDAKIFEAMLWEELNISIDRWELDFRNNRFKLVPNFSQIGIINFRIIWSSFFEIQLAEIYHYHDKKAISSVATKIVMGIVKESEKFIKALFIGQEVELLKERKTQ